MADDGAWLAMSVGLSLGVMGAVLGQMGGGPDFGAMDAVLGQIGGGI
jgi:uncharacterized membrane protein